MTWGTTPPPDGGNTALVRDRMFSDMLATERKLRESSMDIVEKLRKILYDVASRLDGQRVQDMQRNDPAAFLVFTPDQWKDFFARAPIAPTYSRSVEGSEIERLTNDLAKAQQEISNLRGQIISLRAANTAAAPAVIIDAVARTPEPDPVFQPRQDYRQQAAQAKSTGKAQQLSGGQSAQKPKTKQQSVQAQMPISRPSPNGKAAGTYIDIVRDLLNWRAPACPSIYKHQATTDTLRWRRQSMALYIMAVYGLSNKIELDYIIARAESVKSNTSALRTAISELANNNLAIDLTHMVKSGEFSTSLTLMRLSEDGHSLCKMLGWQPIESEWGRLIRTHEADQYPDHTFSLMVFALQSRLREWHVDLVPEVSGSAKPDALIQKGSESYYVEVETGNRDKPDKWRNLAGTQGGKVAICTVLADQRKQLVSDCKNMGLQGVAVDLESIVKAKLDTIGPDLQLWNDVWL